MKKKWKRVLALVLTATMLIGCYPLDSMAVDVSANDSAEMQESTVSDNEDVSSNEEVSMNTEMSANAEVSANTEVSENVEEEQSETEEPEIPSEVVEQEIEVDEKIEEDYSIEVVGTTDGMENTTSTTDGADEISDIMNGEQIQPIDDELSLVDQNTTAAVIRPAKPKFETLDKTITLLQDPYMLEISVLQNDCVCYYSLDGKNPTYKKGVIGDNTFLYTEPIKITGKAKTVIKAIAVNELGVCSKVATQIVKLQPDVATVEIKGIQEVPLGKSISLSAEITPSHARNKKVLWEIKDYDKSNGVKVSKSGKVTASKKAVLGTYTIIATAMDRGKVFAEYDVVVTEKPTIKKAKFSTKSLTFERYDSDIQQSLRSYFSAETLNGTSSTVEDFLWTSNKPDIVSVDQAAIVTLHGCGSAKITALARDGSGKKASITIKVKQYVTDITITTNTGSENAFVQAGKKLQLKAKIEPTKVTKKKLKWTSTEDKSIFRVSSSGKVTTYKRTPEGKYTVTCSATDGSGVSEEVIVTVNNGSVYNVSAQEHEIIIFKNTNLADSDAKTTGEVVFEIGANGAYRKELCEVSVEENDIITYSISTAEDEDTGKVLCKVNVMANGSGTGVVRIRCSDIMTGQISSFCDVKVQNMASSMVVQPKVGMGTVLAAGYSVPFEVVIEEEYGEIASHDVVWSTDDESVATIDQDGNLLGVSKGEVKITATLQDGSNMRAHYTVRIVDGAIKSIEVGHSDIVLYRTKATNLTKTSQEISVVVNGTEGFAIEACEAISEDESVLRVSRSGEETNSDGSITVRFNVYTTGVATGKYCITITSTDGSKLEEKVNVTIKNPPSGIKIVEPEGRGTSLAVGHELELIAEIEEAYGECDDVEVVWSSDNENVATVSDMGIVTPKTSGKVVITAKIEDVGLSVSKTYTVAESVINSITTANSEYILFTQSLSCEKALTQNQEISFTLSGNGKFGEEAWEAITSDSQIVGITNTASSGNIAKVKITAVAAGEATITVRSTDGGNVSHEIKVIVKNPASSIKIVGENNADGYIKLGTSMKLSVILGEEYGVCDHTVKWTTSNPTVATIDENSGVLKALKVNTNAITITATMQDGSGITATYSLFVVKGYIQSLTVKDLDSNLIDEVEIVKNDPTKAKLNQVKINLTSTGETDYKKQAIGYEVSEEGIVTITPGTIKATTTYTITATGEKSGVVDVTFKALDGSGVTAFLKVYVTSTIQTMEIIPEDGRGMYIQKGDTLQLYAKGYDDAGDLCSEKAIWSSGKPSVATVDASTGLVTAVGTGDATITAKATDEGGVTTTYKVTVVAGAVTGYSLSKNEINIYSNKPSGMDTVISDKIVVTVTGTKGFASKAIEFEGDMAEFFDFSIGTITTVSDTKKKYTLTITANGKGEGSGTVRIHSTDGTNIYSEDINISITTPPSKIEVTLEENRAAILPVVDGYTLQLYAQVMDGFGDCCKEVEWKSSNEKYATVDQSGLVTPVKYSSSSPNVTITATAKDGSGVYGSIKINLRKGATTSVTVDPENYTFNLESSTKSKVLKVNFKGTGSYEKAFRVTVDDESVVTATGKYYSQAATDTTDAIERINVTVSLAATAKKGDSTWVRIHTMDGSKCVGSCQIFVE